MAKFGKWIGGALGWTFLGPIGGLLGFLIGTAIDATNIHTSYQYGPTTQGDFLMSLLVLVAAVMKADGKVLKSELDFVRQYLVRSFGTANATEAIRLLRDVLNKEIPVDQVCDQIKTGLDHSSRLQLLHFLYGIAQADGHVHPKEVKLIDHIAYRLGISAADKDSIKSMFIVDTDASYRILEISRDATDEEVKKTYRKMANKYHPDKVAYLGEDLKKSANEKFQKLNEAYEKIMKERSMV